MASANGLPSRTARPFRVVPSVAGTAPQVPSAEVAAKMARARAATRPALVVVPQGVGHGQPRKRRIPIVVAVVPDDAISGKRGQVLLVGADVPAIAAASATPVELVAPAVPTRMQQPAVLGVDGPSAVLLVVAPVAHRLASGDAVRAVNDAVAGPRRLVRRLGLVARTAGLAALPQVVAVAVPTAAAVLVAGPGVERQVRRPTAEVLLAADGRAGQAGAPSGAGLRAVGQGRRQPTTVVTIAPKPAGRPVVHALVLENVAPISPAVPVGLAAAVLEPAEPLEQERQRTAPSGVLALAQADGAVLVGSRRPAELGGPPIGVQPAIKDVAVLAPAVEAVAVELRVEAVGVLLAVAAEPAEVGVAKRQLEAKRKVALPAAVKLLAGLPVGAAGVARAAVPVVVAHATTAGRTGQRRSGGPPVVAVDTRGPNGTAGRAHDASARVLVVPLGVRIPVAVAQVEGGLRRTVAVVLRLDSRFIFYRLGESPGL